MTLVLVLSGIVLFVLGAAVGSFLNVVVHRTLAGEDWSGSRSRCDHCGRQIAWYDNIPLLSFVALGGRCRHCRQPISLSHLVFEMLTGLLFVWWYLAGFVFFQLTQAPFQVLQPLFWLIVGVLLLIIAVTDALFLIIPDAAVMGLFMLTVLYRVVLVSFGIMRPLDLALSVAATTAAAALFWLLWRLTRGRGLGLGDVKLVVPIGLLVGWPQLTVALLAAFVTGALVGVGLIGLGKRRLGQVIPFGPFLVAGTLVALTAGGSIIRWYLSLL
ncbi:MAG: prepilin peptidase [Candidatus Pacebacteria bacterium CG10_big_fil_rev_8_21_14_0_10_56_10]|nr:MAG: prepilin peptidase [Candidatus Pacebacteria bacterium CG10_big_fil_rev_8_21_14_0_10_56_10]